MNNQELKIIWKLAKLFFITSISIWILETAFFLLIDGWHLKATNPIEIKLDEMVGDMFHVALYISTYICVGALINLNRN